MASFQPFKITTNGLSIQYKAQTGKELKFTKFILGDGTYTGSIRDLTALVSPKETANVKRLSVTGTGTNKKVIIGFDIDTSKITTGFYLREIGLYAKDPDTNEEVLIFYTNAGDTADYISNKTSTTISTKMINAELYISDVANITATIDTSMTYATASEVNALSTQLETLEGNIYTKDEVDAKVSSVYKYKGTVATYNALPTSGQVVGDVYNVESNGMNYAWTETGWDPLGGTVDLTDYLKKTGNGSDITTTFTEASARENIITGEKLSILFGKIKKFFTDLKTVAFSGSFTDLSNKPTITSQTTVTNFWNGTQAQYNAIETKDANTLYLIDKE